MSENGENSQSVFSKAQGEILTLGFLKWASSFVHRPKKFSVLL